MLSVVLTSEMLSREKLCAEDLLWMVSHQKSIKPNGCLDTKIYDYTTTKAASWQSAEPVGIIHQWTVSSPRDDRQSPLVHWKRIEAL